MLLFAAGCASHESATSTTWYRLGAGAGPAFVALDHIELGRSMDTRVAIDNDTGVASILEAGMQSKDSLLLARLQYVRSEHDVPDFAASATVEQYRLACLFGPAPFGWDLVALQPLVGVGFGALTIDFADNPFLHDMRRGMVDLDLGLEVVVGRHLTLGSMLTVGEFGDLGVPAGSCATAAFYGGLRF